MTYALNDLGNAKRFAVRWLSELAYVEYPERITRQHNDSPWFAYSQELETWEMIHEPELFEYAAIVADELQAEAGDDEKLQRWATKTGEIPRIKRMLKLARFYMEATPEDVDLVVWKKGRLLDGMGEHVLLTYRNKNWAEEQLTREWESKQHE